MASPTETEMDAQLQGAVLLLDNLLAQQTVPTEEDAYNQILISDFATAQSNGARLFRRRVAGAVASGSSVLNPLLTAYTHHIVGTPERTPQPALDRIYEFFVDNAKTVKSRGITYGTIASFGTDKGLLVRLTEDENGYDLENEFVEAKVVTCIQDANTGAERFREVFELRGGSAGVDALDATSSGSVKRNFMAKDSSTSLLANSSFSRYVIAGSFTSSRAVLASGDTVTSWTLNNDAVGFALDQNAALVARDIVGDTTPTSLVFLTGATRTATQAFSVNRLKLSADQPYLTSLWVYPHASLTAGTMTITWGSKSQAVTLTTLTAGEWNQVIVDRDQDIWPASFNETDAEFSVSITSHDQEVLVDEVRFGTMEPFDGTWWYVGSSDAAQFELDDQVTVTDAFAGSDSKIQKWLWRTYGRYLPHHADATQIPAAGGRTLTFNDNGGSADTITLSTGDCAADGYVAGQTLTVAGTSSNDGTYVLTVVAATTLTVATGSFTAEGPLSATATLDAGPSIADPA